MPFEIKVALPGSERFLHPNATHIGASDCGDSATVTIVLRRHKEPQLKEPVAHENYEYWYGAHPEHITAVEAFAHHAGLTVVESSAKKRTVKLAGPISALSAAFDAPVACFQLASGQSYRGRTGHISIPEELECCIMAVLGMDTRPVAQPHFRMRAVSAPSDVEPELRVPAGCFTPLQVAQQYDFPSGLTGKGETIAIIELGGGYRSNDLKTYFTELKVPQPNITAVSVDGGKNAPGSDSDGEVMLDIEIAGAIAPQANIAVYFAANTDQGFLDAISQAVHDTVRKPSVISISWGGPEDSWTPQAMNALNAACQDAAALGVTVLASAGDDGSSDGMTDGHLHVDFPASSPYVLACGGTKLVVSNGKISSETVWNETANGEGAGGGGVSNTFPRPSYQDKASVPAQPETGYVGRGVPDIAGVADPETGFFVRVNGQDQIVGGTSAQSPLWAGAIALINQRLGPGKSVGFLNPRLYLAPSDVFREISQGNNDDAGLGSFSAGPGWNACSGRGVPRGEKLLEYLAKPPTSTQTYSAS